MFKCENKWVPDTRAVGETLWRSTSIVKKNYLSVVCFKSCCLLWDWIRFRLFLGSERRAASIFGVEYLKLKIKVAGTYLPNYTVSQPRRQRSYWSSPWEPQISLLCIFWRICFFNHFHPYSLCFKQFNHKMQRLLTWVAFSTRLCKPCDTACGDFNMKVKMSLFMPSRHVGEWKYESLDL